MIDKYEPEDAPKEERIKKTERLTRDLKTLLQDPKVRVKTLSISDPESDYIMTKLNENSNNAPEVINNTILFTQIYMNLLDPTSSNP